MAAKPINPVIAEAIITDWRLGQMSQRQIADKHGVSNGKVAGLTKGVEQDAASIVSSGVAYKQALKLNDERIVSAVEREVDKQTKWLDWLHTAMMKNAQESMSAKCNDQKDHFMRARTLQTSKEGIVGKDPDVVLNNNMLTINKVERSIVRPSDTNG